MSIEIKWGRDTVKWGDDTALWGREIPSFSPDEAVFAFAFSAEYPDGTAIHTWTGIGDVTVGGINYVGVGPDVVQIGEQAASLTGQGRMTVTLSAIDPDHRNLFLQDPGRVKITVRTLYSNNGGQTWLAIPRFHRGLLSRPQLQGGQYSVEVSTYRDTLNRGFEDNWSDENQQRDYPGDLGFEHL